MLLDQVSNLLKLRHLNVINYVVVLVYCHLNHRVTTNPYTVSEFTVTMVTASDIVDHRVITNPYTVSDLL